MAVGAVITAAVLVARSPAGRRQISASTSRQPAAFTELYFTAPTQLPKRLSLTRPNSIGFTIANHEGAAVTYTYTVVASTPEQTQTIAEAALPVASGATASASVDFTPPRTGVAYVFTISLAGRTESIRFTGTS